MQIGRIRSTLLGLATAVMLALPAHAQNTVAHVATLEWPPYTGEHLPKGGATTEVVREAFANIGFKSSVDYRPWKRAIDMAAKGTDGVIAYYPGYHCHHREGFVTSNPIGNGPLGFAENTDAPITWDTIDSLGEQKLKIGTVLGYANTDEFDAKAGTGWIIAIPSKDDLTNLKKLARRRIDAAVIDKFVLEYLKATEPSLEHSRNKLRFNSHALEEKTLYLCFRDDDEGRALRDAFNEGLAKVNPDQIADEYFAHAFTD